MDIRLRINNLIDASQHWEMAEESAEIRKYEDLTYEIKDELIAEFERMQAEIDHLRWHYPVKDGYPQNREEVIVDCSWITTAIVYKNYFVEIDNQSEKKELGEIQRWRYIE